MDEGDEIERLRKELRYRIKGITMLVALFVACAAIFYLNALGVLRIGSDVYSLVFLSGDDIFFIVYMVILVLGIVYVAVKYRRLRRKIMLLEQRHREDGGGADDRDG